MKDHKVQAIIEFNDVEEEVLRKKDDIFDVTKERFEYLNQKKAVKLIKITAKPTTRKKKA